MNLFFVQPEDLQSNSFRLRDQEAHHAAHVMRLQPGDHIALTNGKGLFIQGKIESISRNEVQGNITQQQNIEPENHSLILGLGLIRKRDRLEFAIEKAVELGVSKILLFHSDHSEQAPLKVKRLKLIAQSAMKQSLRYYLPQITVLDKLSEVLSFTDYDAIYIAHEKAEPQLRMEPTTLSGKLLLLVGPEGGFSEREVEEAMQCGANMISLGKHRLRAETAAIKLLSVLT